MPTYEEVIGSEDASAHLDVHSTVVHVNSNESLDAVHYIVYRGGGGHIWLYRPLADPGPLILLGVPGSALSVLAMLKIARRHFDIAYFVSDGKAYFDTLNAMGG